jgi:hypothetical protein
MSVFGRYPKKHAKNTFLRGKKDPQVEQKVDRNICIGISLDVSWSVDTPPLLSFL